MTLSIRLLALGLFLFALTITPAAGGRSVRVVVLTTGDIASAKSLVAPGDVVLAPPARVGRYSMVRLEVTPERAAALADAPGVARVWPWTPPRLHDERSDQVAAGAIGDTGQLSGPGYLAWLDARGLAAASATIDVTDSGFDRGTADDVPPELADAAGTTRVLYARDFTLDGDAHDISGHGTLNASIAAGYGTDSPDAAGYQYGLGVAPGARVGSSRIFNDRGDFELFNDYSAVSGPAWRDGARVSSNSWGSPANIYTPDSIEYDAIVRDADPTTPGNQGMVVVFSAGNEGPNGHVETPGTSKNVITVGAAEGVRPGTDGCGVNGSNADSAVDVAFFSGGGPVDDGRVKPDIVAPGTHVTGTKSRADGYNGKGVCGEGFPGDATRFTWSSGTSHAAPAVAGAASLLVSWLERERGAAPSPALVKAWLLNTTRYLTGASAHDDLPSQRQGWGLLDLSRALDDAPRVVVDQSELFTSIGDAREYVCVPADASRPVRVTLAWTDAPGDPGAAPELNDLDLEVEANGQLYRGNHFARDVSAPGGLADTRNTVEGVWLPAGGGPFRVRVRASALEDDGVPGNAFGRDQDFALVVYNADARSAALFTVAATSVDRIDPGGEGVVRLAVTNRGDGASGPATLTLSGGAGVTVADGGDTVPALAPGETVELERGFRVDADASVPCGALLGLVAHVADVAAPVEVRAGAIEERVLYEDDAEGEPRWTFETPNRGATWSVVTDHASSGTHSWHADGSTVSGDSWIFSEPIAIPADAVAARFEYWQTYSFERGFDGGIVEVSDGGPWVDAGPLAVENAYPLNISGLFGNTLGTRPAYTGGDVGAFRRVAFDMTPYAGRIVRVRLRIGADARVGSAGWWADDFRMTASVPSCSASGGLAPAVTSASYKNGKLKLKGTSFAPSATIVVNGRTVLVPASFVAAKGVLRVKADAATLDVRSGLNVVTVETSGRRSRAFAFTY